MNINAQITPQSLFIDGVQRRQELHKNVFRNLKEIFCFRERSKRFSISDTQRHGAYQEKFNLIYNDGSVVIYLYVCFPLCPIALCHAGVRNIFGSIPNFIFVEMLE